MAITLTNNLGNNSYSFLGMDSEEVEI